MNHCKEIFYGHIINGWKGIIRGRALVSRHKISFLGDVDIETGKIVDPHSDIKGESIRGKVLFFKGGRGSTVGASVMYGLAKKKTAPLALVTVDVDPVIVAGAVFGDIPLISKIPEDALSVVSTGDIVEIVPISNKEAIIRVI